MRNIFIKNNKQKGYAILFTLVIVSAISVVTAGLTNAVYKQVVLSSLARDSQAAFYQADTAADCAMYADWVEYDGKFKHEPKESSIFDEPTWSCGNTDPDDIEDNLIIAFKDPSDTNKGYTIKPTPDVVDKAGPCFMIDVEKIIEEESNTIKSTTIRAKGYSTCDLTNPRAVEREIQIDY